jgi:OOP family OmpA-OmpF porin
MPTLALVIAFPILMGLNMEKAADAAQPPQATQQSAAFDSHAAFGQALADEYGALSTEMKAGQPDDFGDAHYFAVKAVSAYEGNIPQPEHMSDWAFSTGEAEILAQARTELIDLLGRTAPLAPQASARAQANFDCWVERAEEEWSSAAAQSCREAFERAMVEADSKIWAATHGPTATESFEAAWSAE